MVKDHLLTVNNYSAKGGELIKVRHTFDLQEARRWRRETPYGEIINQIKQVVL